MDNRTLIFGDDGSQTADVAWLWISSHHWPHWSIRVVTAEMPKSFRASDSATPFEPWQPSSPRVALGSDLDIAHLRIEEDPRIALAQTVDLLVVGARGPGLAKTLGLGSTAEWLISRPPSPMVVVRSGRPTREVVVCSDGSGHAKAAIRALCTMPWTDQIQATIVVVNDRSADVDAAADDAVRSLGQANIATELRVLSGDPVEQLSGYLDRHDPDLVAVGVRGLSGIQRFRLGSTSRAITRTGRHSVLLATQPEPAGSSPDPDLTPTDTDVAS